MKAVIYTRVSTDDQVQGTSPRVQEERCRAYAGERGWLVVDVYSDDGVSGSLESRPALDRPRADFARGAFDVVIATKHDRLARDGLLGLNLLRELRVEFTDEPNEEGLLRFVRMGVAEDERRRIFDRTMSGRRARLRSGSWVGGTPPFGHRIEDKHLVVNEPEAVVIRRAVELILDEGKTLSEAADTLNAERLLSRNRADGSPQRWRAYSLRVMLKRPTLVGEFTWGKRGNEPPVSYEIPAVLDQQRFAALQATLRRSHKPHPTTKRHVYPLALRVTSPCGEVYYGATWGGPRRYYRCKGKERKVALERGGTCSCHSLRADWLEQRVWDQVYGLISDDEALLARVPGADSDDAEAAAKTIAQLRAKIASKETARTSRAAAALEAGLDPALIRDAIAEIDKDLETLRGELDEMIAWHEASSESALRRARLRYFCDLASTLLNPTPEAMADAFAALEVRVSVLGDGSQPEVSITGSTSNAALEAVARHARSRVGVEVSG